MSYSSFDKRCLAHSIDSGITGVVSYAISFLFGDGWFSIILSLIFAMAYFIICEGGECHATVGKRMAGIMVVDESGKGIDFATATKRYFGKIISAFTFYIGFAVAMRNKECRTLHDKIAKTYVVDGVVEKKKYRL